MAKVKTMSVVANLPWWLGEGDEECPHCGQLYVLEMEFRCPDCDRATCPHCKQKHAAGHHTCPECVIAGEFHG